MLGFPDKQKEKNGCEKSVLCTFFCVCVIEFAKEQGTFTKAKNKYINKLNCVQVQ